MRLVILMTSQDNVVKNDTVRGTEHDELRTKNSLR